MVDIDLRAHHRKMYTDRLERTEHGQAMITVLKGRLQVTVQYHPSWPAAGRRLGGRWRPKSQLWSFPWENRISVLHSLLYIYGDHVLTQPWREMVENHKKQL